MLFLILSHCFLTSSCSLCPLQTAWSTLPLQSEQSSVIIHEGTPRASGCCCRWPRELVPQGWPNARRRAPATRKEKENKKSQINSRKPYRKVVFIQIQNSHILQLALPAEISLDHLPRPVHNFNILNRRWHFNLLVKVAFVGIFYHLLQHSA